MDYPLNILTLNCWGVRVPLFGAKQITERIAAIAQLVCDGTYDVVVFEEIWDTADYVALSCKILDKLKYSHYFHGSGFLGSGLCVFSRYPIAEAMYFNFPLNGHAHKILHGDWYGAKGCGLAVLRVHDMTVNLYVSHMHARYNHNNEFDEYSGHRATQAFSLSQFVKHTSVACDAVLLAGDFNSTPTEAAYRIIRSNAVLNDAWLVKNTEGSHPCAGATCDTADNCFTPASVTAQIPNGQRIDYIFYRANDQTDLRLDSCKVLTDKIPGTDMDYSDHFGINAQMFIKRNITARQIPELDTGVRKDCLNEVGKAVDKGNARARYNKYFYFVTMLLTLMILLICREAYLGDGGGSLHGFFEVLQGIMAVMSGLSFWIWFVLCRCEENAYRSMRSQINLMVFGSSDSRAKKTD